MVNKDFKKFIELTDQHKHLLLQALDFSVDEQGFIIGVNSKKYICPYTKRPVHFKEASILPGSTVIINTSLISLSEYISDYLEKNED